jgi:hypothetical protein
VRKHAEQGRVRPPHSRWSRAHAEEGVEGASSSAFSADDVFGDDDTTPASTRRAPADTRFAQLLLEESSVTARAQPRDEIVLGDQRTSPLPSERQGNLLAEDQRAPVPHRALRARQEGRELLEDGSSAHPTSSKTRSTASSRTSSRASRSKRTADPQQGAQTETLCVVSVVDDRNSESGRQIVCFGTKSTDHRRARGVHAPRGGARLGSPACRGAPRPALRASLQEARRAAPSGRTPSSRARSARRSRRSSRSARNPDLLGQNKKLLKKLFATSSIEIAGSFGIGRRARTRTAASRWRSCPEPRHRRDPDESQKPGFKNPLQGVRIYDRDDRLLGFIVYVASTKGRSSPAETLETTTTSTTSSSSTPTAPSRNSSSGRATRRWWSPHARLRSPSFDGEGGVVQLLSRFFVVSKSAIEKPKQLADRAGVARPAPEGARRRGAEKEIAAERQGPAQEAVRHLQRSRSPR